MTWDASTGYWNWSDGEQWGDQGDTPIFFLVGTPVNCQTAGGWSLQTLESGSLLLSYNFSLSHDSPLLGITSPSDNQLFDLDQQNYTATGPVPFVALTNTGNFINWAANLQYATSGGYGSMTDGPRNFQTATAEEHDETYQSEGGQVEATASTTASDGSTIQDCVTFYIDGPQSGIPDATITAQLESSSQSYPRSKSYPSDGTGTQALMAQVAATESSYAQFQTPALCNGHPDLWSLDADAGILAKWPEEPYTDDQSGTCIGTDGGSHIGLMQVVTDSDQSSDPNAWNRITNAADGVGLFSGTPPAEYGTKSNKMQTAANYEKEIMSSYPHGSLPMLEGWQLEDMALLLYGPGASSDLGKQYWEPTCAGTVNSKGQFSTGWQWTENRSGNPAGRQYADGVRAETVP